MSEQAAGREPDKDFMIARYSALMNLWQHHNTVQLQWPAVILGTALLVVSAILRDKVTEVLDLSQWGQNNGLRFGVGLPLLLTGSSMIALLYIMGRGRKIMARLENEIVLIEQCFRVPGEKFRTLNHPPGLSGVNLIRRFMAVAFPLPTTLAGMILLFGLGWGIAGEVALLWACLIIWTWRYEEKSL